MASLISNFVKKTVLEFVCPHIGFSDNEMLEDIFDDHCIPYLKGLHGHYNQMINAGAAERENTACAKLQLVEAKWYRRARDFGSALRKYAEIERNLYSPEAQGRGLVQDADGSMGACVDNWFLKLDATMDLFFSSSKTGPLPAYPAFLDEINSPDKLEEMFDRYLLSKDEKYRGRDEHALNCLTGLVALLYQGMPPGYDFHPRLKEALTAILDERWQDESTGFWGKTVIEGGKEVFYPHISLTFHIINYREFPEGTLQINHWSRIIDTLLSLKDKEWPEGWLEDGKFCYHHNYDVMKIFRLGWKNATPDQRKRMFAEIRAMLETGTQRIMSEDYNFDDSNGEDIEESLSYHVFFLMESEIYEKGHPFWENEGTVNLPPRREMAEKLLKKFDDFNVDANMELKYARDVVRHWLTLR